MFLGTRHILTRQNQQNCTTTKQICFHWNHLLSSTACQPWQSSGFDVVYSLVPHRTHLLLILITLVPKNKSLSLCNQGNPSVVQAKVCFCSDVYCVGGSYHSKKLHYGCTYHLLSVGDSYRQNFAFAIEIIQEPWFCQYKHLQESPVCIKDKEISIIICSGSLIVLRYKNSASGVIC